LNIADRIDGGQVDFGFRPHQGGAPADGSISLFLGSSGVVSGRVNGFLFWDSLFGGDATVAAITNFQNRDGVNVDEDATGLNGTGCCATDIRNQALVDHRGQSTEIFRIRLRVGRVTATGGLTGVTSKTYSFGCSVGTAEGIPADTTVRVGDDTVYGVEWTVPDPENWHSLDSIDIRLIDAEDAEDEILRVRFDEATNTFSEFNPHKEEYRKPGLPGSSEKFESSAVTMFLKNSEVIGSGPDGPSVQLNLQLNFKPKAAGRTFTVQVLATNDSGIDQGWESVGEITVLPRGKVK
jgi:hypothetical protein